MIAHVMKAKEQNVLRGQVHARWRGSRLQQCQLVYVRGILLLRIYR